MNDALPDAAPAPSTAAAHAQEIDVWWGAYSGWTLLPSVALCVVLTAGFAWSAPRLLDPTYAEKALWAFAAVLWLAQGLRWVRRILGYQYRLTTARVLSMHGHFWVERRQAKLDEIKEVHARIYPAGRWLAIGSVIIVTKEGAKLVLEGVRRADQAAERIRKACAPS